MSPSFDPPPATSNSFSRPRPQPRPPKSPAHSAQIRVQNRRREYLDRNPTYFQSTEHELADPLLYDSLIRKFQSPAEREAEGRKKGYARVLEGSLLRGEERLAKLAAESAAASGSQHHENGAPIPIGQGSVEQSQSTPQQPSTNSNITVLEAEMAVIPPATTKEDGREQWEMFLRERFIRGADEDFEYARIDEDEEYDVIERREQEEAWFEDEDPDWASTNESHSPNNDDQDTTVMGQPAGGVQPGQRRFVERVLEGETGVQDF
ncbi:coiled-coil domain-containing protein-domain-containing protein [Apodospora peruviana]|uniref:Coiled-coil domain-containing protein-domain-containing protein n=1 Tax=Apodospora peruviana TaxID=516989 RepID=A0AAE0MG10_9PEZI|nr:coiled-coil domain-containing protein-domain-containing protein [Apodospora peruviana]